MLFWLACGMGTALVGIGLYFRLFELRKRVRSAQALLDIYLRSRHDLLATFLSNFEGSLEIEGRLLKDVIEARSRVLGASSGKHLSERYAAESQLTRALSSLIDGAKSNPKGAVVDPELSRYLKELESDGYYIAFTQDYFDQAVAQYHSIRETRPGRFVGRLFRFQKMDLLPPDIVDRKR